MRWQDKWNKKGIYKDRVFVGKNCKILQEKVGYGCKNIKLYSSFLSFFFFYLSILYLSILFKNKIDMSVKILSYILSIYLSFLYVSILFKNKIEIAVKILNYILSFYLSIFFICFYSI